LPDFNETLAAVFENYSYIKFHENPSSGSQVVPCGRTDGHDEALTVTFRNFVEEPKTIIYINSIIKTGLVS